MHHGACVTHLPWCMSRSLTRGSREKVPGISGACARLNFTYLVRDPWQGWPQRYHNMLLSWWHKDDLFITGPLLLGWTSCCTHTRVTLSLDVCHLANSKTIRCCHKMSNLFIFIELWLVVYYQYQLFTSPLLSGLILNWYQFQCLGFIWYNCTVHHCINVIW